MAHVREVVGLDFCNVGLKTPKINEKEAGVSPFKKTSEFDGDRHSSVDLPAPSIRRSPVQIASAPFTLCAFKVYCTKA